MPNKNHMRMFKCFLVVSLFSIIVAGCAGPQTGILPKSAIAPKQNESFIIQGLNPGYRVVFFKGKIIDGKFVMLKDEITFFAGQSEGGYIVGQANAGDIIAATSINRVRTKSAGPRNFQLCAIGPVKVFEIPAGKVSYLGDMTLSSNMDKNIRINYTSNIDEARNYIHSTYPLLKGEVDSLKYRMLPVKCPNYKTQVFYMRTYY